MKNVDHASAIAAHKPAGFLKEADQFRRCMGCFEEAERLAHSTSSIYSLSDGDRTVREALWEVLEDYAREFERMRSAFRAEIQGDLERLDRVQRQQLVQAEMLLVDGLLEEPHERSRILRESRRLYHEVTAEAGFPLCCAVWAQYCWLTWQLTANEDDTLIPLEFAVNQPSSGAGIGKALCARLYAYLLARIDRFDDAYEWCSTSAAIWPCLGALHERVRYALLAGKADVVRRDVDALVKEGVLGIVFAYAEPLCGLVQNDLLEGAIREQLRLRQIARQSIAEWQAVVRKAAEVRHRLPGISLPHDLTDGVETARALNDEAGFLVAAQQIQRAESAKEDLKCLAVAAVNAEKRKQTEAIAQARKNIDAALEGRDQWIKASFAKHEQALQEVRSVLGKADAKGEAAQRGCGWGLSTGCGILMCYIFLACILATRGVAIGPRTPAGTFLLVLAGLPIMISIIYHMVYSARRMLLESQVNSQVATSTQQYEKAREQANAEFRERIEASQQKLAEEEAQLLLVEEAARIFA